MSNASFCRLRAGFRFLVPVLAFLLCGGLSEVSFKSSKITGFKGGDDAEEIEVTGHFAKPDGAGPFPAVVLLYACGGLKPHVTEDWPDLLTKKGYATFTVDTLGARNATNCLDLEDRDEHMTRDALGALDFLAKRADIDPRRIGAMGFSYGANVVNAMAMFDYRSAQKRRFRAGIAVYGRCKHYALPAFPLMEIIGDQDRAMVDCLEYRDVGAQVEVIKDAYHAFDQSQIRRMRVVAGDHNAIYSQEATEQAEKLALRFLETHLAK